MLRWVQGMSDCIPRTQVCPVDAPMRIKAEDSSLNNTCEPCKKCPVSI